MIASLALLAILQAPDDLVAFLASLEKDKSTLQQKLEKIDAWSTGKSEDVLARLAWNKGLTESAIRIDALFVEGLKKRVGKQVTFGRTTGVLKEVKPDRVVLGVAGGTIDLEFAAIAHDVRLEDIKKEGLLPAQSAEEAIFRFAGTKSVAALATALALPAGNDRERAFAAIAGWALQETDKALAAGPTVKAAENFAATWGKQAELLAAADGALRKFVDVTLGPKLVEEADAVLEKDRKEARKLLDLASALCKADDIREKVSERRWAVMDKGEWMAIPLDAISEDGGELKGSALAYEDTNEEKEKLTGLRIKSLGVGWDEISGVKARVKPIKGDIIDMRFSFTDPAEEHSVAVHIKEGMGWRGHFVAGKEPKIGAGSTRKVPKKADYEFIAQWEGKKWKYSVGATEIDTFQAGEPKELYFFASDGNAELLSLQIRKK